MESKAEEQKVLAPLEFTMDQKKTLNTTDQAMIMKSFRNYDTNNNGVMDQNEFKNIMIDIGYRKITDDKCAEMLAAQDQDNDGVLSWVEFVDMMAAMKAVDDGKFGNIVQGKGGAVA
jgi:Ca2+-binding EF-hand superfamily protein